MTNIKSHTDINQSKKLAEILPIESADMYYCYGMDIRTKVWSFDDTPTIIDNSNQIDIDFDIPCWSLAVLLSVLPAGKSLIHGENTHKYKLINCLVDDVEWYDNPVDACAGMIEKLHELKVL